MHEAGCEGQGTQKTNVCYFLDKEFENCRIEKRKEKRAS